jgi:ribosome-associated protein
MRNLKTLVLTALEDIKADNIDSIEVSNITTIADHMIIATGTSTRHIQAISNNVIRCVKAQSYKPLGVEGTSGSDWILIDLGDIIVHIMLSQTRDFYNLEKLWQPMQLTATAAN